MMKTKTTVLLYLLCAVLMGCVSSRTSQHGGGPEEIQRLFVGTWEGEYMDQEGNLVRSWTQNRFADGTYTIAFLYYSENGVREIAGKGKWWLEGSRFFEMAHTAKEPDVYEFDVVSHDEILFKSVATDYAFTDRRVSVPKKPSFI